MILKEIQPCTIDPVFEIKEYKCNFGWQVMIIGLSGVQLSLLLYKWVVKLDKQEVRIQLVIRVLLKTIGWNKVLLPINQNYGKIFRLKFIFNVIHFHAKKQQLTWWNARQQSMHVVHLYSHYTHTVQLHRHDAYIVQFQAWLVHCPIGAQIWLVITNHGK